jgi:hypothetical integral membrane protein (TIGR02206 family)
MASAHYQIPLLSGLWWGGLSIATAVVSFPLIWLRNKSETFVAKSGKIIGALLLIVSLLIHIYLIWAGKWDLRSSLPLQLCSMSAILSGLIFFVPNQLLFELLIYWGLPGAVHSLLTPEMSQGFSPFLYIEYYIAHAGIILASLFLITRMDFYVRERSWYRIFIFTQIFIIGIGFINYAIGANYMYLCQKPIAENPFVIGNWPWYVLGLELAGLLHFYLVYFILKKTGKVMAN